MAGQPFESGFIERRGIRLRSRRNTNQSILYPKILIFGPHHLGVHVFELPEVGAWILRSVLAERQYAFCTKHKDPSLAFRGIPWPIAGPARTELRSPMASFQRMAKCSCECSIWGIQFTRRKKFHSYAVLSAEELACIQRHAAGNFLKQAITLHTAIGMDSKNLA